MEKMVEDVKSIASKSAQTPSDTISIANETIGNGTLFNDSTDGYSATGPVHAHESPEVTITKREDSFIKRAKVLVATVLLVAVSSVATVAFFLITDQEHEGFENQFKGHASELTTVVSQRLEKAFQALDATSVMITSEASVKSTTWPFMTIDHWSSKAERLFELSDIGDSFLAFAPIVEEEITSNWTTYVETMAPSWYQTSISRELANRTVQDFIDQTIPYIHIYDADGSRPTVSEANGPAAPIWQSYPLRNGAILPSINDLPTNYDLLGGFSNSSYLILNSNASRHSVVSFPAVPIDTETPSRRAKSSIVFPIFDQVDAQDNDAKVVAVLWWQIDWSSVLARVLDRGVNGIIAVIQSSCPTSDLKNRTSSITYRINGRKPVLVAERDVHDTKYDEMEVSQVLVDFYSDELKPTATECIPKVTLHLYPTSDFRDKFVSQNGLYYAGVVVLVFCFTSVVFLIYDFLVKERQKIVMDRIMRQDMIVSDVFPSAIRDRLYNKNIEDRRESNADELLDPMDFGTSNIIGSAPLADLFPNTTVIFADIVGFTAWSSAREPSQVFVLLETIYNAYDKIAYRHGVFKVETVGDCYVAVAGLPEPHEEHAVIATRFARSCLKKMKEITLKLEMSLGPDTADLDMRIGVHSGQVTAGVLRGERSRFQLFGDTMNTAARMEHTGERNRIQLTQATADLLKEAGLGRWIIPRSSTIFVKGKGNMQTYWVKTMRPSKPKKPKLNRKSDIATIDETIKTDETASMGVSEPPSDDSDDDDDIDFDIAGLEGMSKTDRLVEWHVETLSTLLQQIIGSRGGDVQAIDSLREVETSVGQGGTVLEEFVPIIALKQFKPDELRNRVEPSEIDIGEAARSQLRKLISTYAYMYKENTFHNFEHASHVTASVKKLLSRIVNVGYGNGLASQRPAENVNLIDLAGHSYGITSDPLTQFAVVFSAIIHDVDHPGVPNAQLVKENTRNAQIYKNKSVAEQNSVDLAWQIFMHDDYKDLRACIYQTECDLQRFRQLVVNTVMATDIVDKELQALRKKRWETAFSAVVNLSESEHLDIDRKATIVIEHLIQASDVSHTMQHWHIYKTWNEKFFMECYGAYKAGRAETDPSVNWYKGEIGFFDFYVIPLAKKLDDCGVFGVSSDEYLNYAKGNREEWVREGENIVKELLAKYEQGNNKGEYA